MKRFLKKIILDLLWAGARERVRVEKPFVIAITGSVGKTTAKEAIAAVLEAGGRTVVKTQGNMGSDIGVPLSLLGYAHPPHGSQWIGVALRSFFAPTPYKGKHPLYVLEYSSDKPGDIAFLTGKIRPDYAVLTVIAPVHMGFYSQFSDLVKEKGSLPQALSVDGIAILNADDISQKPLFAGSYKALGYSVEGGRASVSASAYELTDIAGNA